jgi:hypothetical protein
MFVADVIFPAFSAPYLAWFFFPVAALLAMFSEVLVFRLRNNELTWGRAAAITAGANLVSWFFGLLLSLVLPSGLVPHLVRQPGGKDFRTITQGPHYGTYMILGFIVALILSILIEYRVWLRYTHKAPLRDCLNSCILANVASYAVLIGMACSYVYLNWW